MSKPGNNQYEYEAQKELARKREAQERDDVRIRVEFTASNVALLLKEMVPIKVTSASDVDPGAVVRALFEEPWFPKFLGVALRRRRDQHFELTFEITVPADKGEGYLIYFKDEAQRFIAEVAGFDVPTFRLRADMFVQQQGTIEELRKKVTTLEKEAKDRRRDEFYGMGCPPPWAYGPRHR